MSFPLYYMCLSLYIMMIEQSGAAPNRLHQDHRITRSGPNSPASTLPATSGHDAHLQKRSIGLASSAGSGINVGALIPQISVNVPLPSVPESTPSRQAIAPVSANTTTSQSVSPAPTVVSPSPSTANTTSASSPTPTSSIAQQGALVNAASPQPWVQTSTGKATTAFLVFGIIGLVAGTSVFALNRRRAKTRRADLGFPNNAPSSKNTWFEPEFQASKLLSLQSFRGNERHSPAPTKTAIGLPFNVMTSQPPQPLEPALRRSSLTDSISTVSFSSSL
jgi:hypothetical protein